MRCFHDLKSKKNKKFVMDEDRREYLSHISYYSVTNDEIQELENALNDLEELAAFFYEDFEKDLTTLGFL